MCYLIQRCHMAAMFTISDSESEPSEEVDEGEMSQSSTEKEPSVIPHHTLTLPELRVAVGAFRSNQAELRVTHFHCIQRRGVPGQGEEDAGTSTDGAPFRGRSKSAPPALWAAKKYGQKLRRMSDEFDSLLDKGEMRKMKNTGTARQIHHSKSWWSYLFSHQETEGENNHHENHTHRTE
ncbi:hypothetical protein INR49_011723 [Caranx melampygus]|nr:hypothetical protein INR49_011723 [Caranx melampygus]